MFSFSKTLITFLGESAQVFHVYAELANYPNLMFTLELILIIITYNKLYSAVKVL